MHHLSNCPIIDNLLHDFRPTVAIHDIELAVRFFAAFKILAIRVLDLIKVSFSRHSIDTEFATLDIVVIRQGQVNRCWAHLLQSGCSTEHNFWLYMISFLLHDLIKQFKIVSNHLNSSFLSTVSR